jgi:peptidyl-dipeptidase Dcp
MVLKIAKLRADKATLLGYANFAAYSLEDQTATTRRPSTSCWANWPSRPSPTREGSADLQKGGRRGKRRLPVAPPTGPIYTDKVRAQRFNFDENELKPYFELNNVLTNGVFYAANKLYGLTFKERKDLPVYNPDVRVLTCSTPTASSWPSSSPTCTPAPTSRAARG